MATAKDRVSRQAREELRILRRALPLVALITALIWLGLHQQPDAPDRRDPISVTAQGRFG